MGDGLLTSPQIKNSILKGHGTDSTGSASKTSKGMAPVLALRAVLITKFIVLTGHSPGTNLIISTTQYACQTQQSEGGEQSFFSLD